MYAKTAALVLLGLFCASVVQADIKSAIGGGVEAQCDTTKPWEFKVSRQGGITAGRYLKVSYTFLGELDASKAVVPDVPGSPIPYFHSIPISNPALASYITVQTSATADFAYMGFGATGVPQSGTGATFDGFLVNLLALREFNCASYELTLNAVATKVCFMGLQADNQTCVAHTVPAGTLKMAAAVNKWNWASAGAFWRVGLAINAVGFTTPTVTNDNSPQDHMIIDFIDADNYTISIKVNKKFNRGDNRFVFAAANYQRTGGDVTVDLDVARSNLINNGGGWFFYDPEVNVRSNGRNDGLGSDAAVHGASFVLVTALIAAVANLF